MQGALDQIQSWPVDHAAAGVLDDDGTVTVSGDPDHPFALASVTKLLTAAAVLVAAEEGTIGLDDQVPVPPGATVRELLSHASGLAPDRDAALAAPRRKRIYSNRGYELLGELVAARSEMPFAQYLHEAVFEPLAMTSSRLDGSPASAGVSTVNDLLRFVAAISPALSVAGTPSVLSDDTREELATIQFPELDGVVPGFGRQAPNPWGLGPEIRGDKHPHWTGSRNSPGTYGHFGRAGTFVWIDPVARIATVALTDRDFDTWATEAWPPFSDTVLAAAR